MHIYYAVLFHKGCLYFLSVLEKLLKNSSKTLSFHSSQLFSVHQKPATTIFSQRKWKNKFSSIMHDNDGVC